MNFSYLACPYASPDMEVMLDRVEASDYYAAQIMLKLDTAVFAPISQGPRVAKHIPQPVAHNHAFWMKQDIRILRVCDRMFLLPMQGWELSKGVGMELALARELEIPVVIIQDASNPLVDNVSLNSFQLNYDIKANIVCL